MFTPYTAEDTTPTDPQSSFAKGFGNMRSCLDTILDCDRQTTSNSNYHSYA